MKQELRNKFESIIIQLTLSCNYKCIMCNRYQEPNYNKKFLSLEIVKSILNQAQGMGIKKVELTGGEPLVYPWINDVLNEIEKLNLSVVILTNGELLSNDILKKLKNIKTEIIISLHAANNALNNTIRGTNSNLAKILTNISLIKQEMRINKNISINICVILMDENKNNLDKISSLLFSHDIKEYEIELNPVDFNMSNIKYKKSKGLKEMSSINLFKQYFDNYLSGMLSKEESLLAKDRGLYIYLLDRNSIINSEWAKSIRLDSNNFNCNENSTYITTKGDVLFCCMLYRVLNKEKFGILGNIYKDSITDILHSKSAKALFKDVSPINNTSKIYKAGCCNCEYLIESFISEFRNKKNHEEGNNLPNKRIIDFIKAKDYKSTRELYINNISNNNCDEERNIGLNNKKVKNHEFEYLKQIITENYELGVKKIILKGREPTVHPDFFNIINFIKSHRMNVEVHTNGRMFYYESFAKKAYQAKINKIIIHFMSKDEKTHDKITKVKSSFNQAKTGIKNIEKYFKKDNLNVLYKTENNITLGYYPVKSTINRYKSYYSGINNKQTMPKEILPFEVELNLTYKCNIECKMCYSKQWNSVNKNNEDIMSTTRIKQLIDEFVKLKINSIILTGGEIFLRDDIIELLQYISKKNIKKTLQTNGTLITNEIAKIICKDNWSIIISFEGSNALVHDSIRGKGTFKLALSGLKKILEMNKKINGNCKISSHLVIQNENVEDLINYANFFGKMGVIPLCDFLGESVKKRFNKNSYIKYINILKKIEEEININQNPHVKKLWDFHSKWANYVKNGVIKKDDLIDAEPARSLIPNNFACLNCDNTVINAYGDVYPCCNLYGIKDYKNNKYSGGNIINNSFKEVWFGQKFAKVRKKLMQIDLKQEPCKTYCVDCVFAPLLIDLKKEVIG